MVPHRGVHEPALVDQRLRRGGPRARAAAAGFATCHLVTKLAQVCNQHRFVATHLLMDPPPKLLGSSSESESASSDGDKRPDKVGSTDWEDPCSQPMAGAGRAAKRPRNCSRNLRPRKSQRARNLASGYSQGPTTLQEVHNWADSYIDHILSDSDMHSRLMQKVNAGIHCNTDYSGSGGFEQSCRMVRQSLESRGVAAGGMFDMKRATDIDACCRRVIMEHTPGPERPTCMFRDLLERLDQHFLEQCRGIVLAFRKKAVGLGKSELKKIGKELLDVLVGEFESRLQSGKPLLLGEAYCVRHQKNCHTHCPTTSGAISMVAGGNSCVDWSVMGSRSGVLGEGILPLLTWLYEVRVCQPDWVLQECTEHFQHCIVEQTLGQHGQYLSFTVPMSPIDLGIPASRPRKFTLSILAAKWKAIIHPNSPEFKEFAFRQLMCYGDIYFAAPDHSVRAYYTDMAAKKGKGMPMTEADWDACMPGAKQIRRRIFEEEASKSERFRDAPVLIANLSQNPVKRPSMMEDIPTLMVSTSALYLLKCKDAQADTGKPPKQRLMIGDEALAVMGWPMWTPEACAISKVQLSDKLKARLAGNGMHIGVVGVLVLWFLCFTEQT